ncbi:MAG: protein-L-isoaspartate(D-aspartate) O-methyltransferase [Planctomycetes bacterium]|nr:protein-L-isoaspartate(D-aspartate) O-methyltransferase [Planctomycetota bacterium]
MPLLDEFDFDGRREQLAQQIEARGLRDPRVLAALRAVHRERYVPSEDAEQSYEDRPLPIGHGQTISDSETVAAVADALRLHGHERLLEIGTGSGYSSAVLAELAREVFTIECIEPLARAAAERLRRDGYCNVLVRCGDGATGWPEFAPFDAIFLGAAIPEIPPALMQQLAPGGRIVAALGSGQAQQLVCVRHDSPWRHRTERLPDVHLEPMATERYAHYV